jgi:hypothetical protein
MAKEEMVAKLRQAMQSPDFWKRLEEARERAEKTIKYLNEASRLPPDWRDRQVTI